MKEIQLTQGKVALVDDEDYEYLNQFKWYANKNANTFYAVRNITINKKNDKKIFMHRFITNNINSKMHTDHLNGNGLDNRKINLRICTQSDNCKNQKMSINNKCGYKGVCQHKNSKKYKSQICYNNNKIYLGLFISIIDAARAYNEAAIKYHGEFANLNKID